MSRCSSSRRWPDFVTRGLPTDGPLAKKLAAVADILQVSPFDPAVLAHNEAQLDFILETYAKHHPERLKFSRPAEVSARAEKPNADAAWADVLRGGALGRFWAKRLPPEGVMKVLRERMAGGIRFRGK